MPKDIKAIKELALCAAKKIVPTDYTEGTLENVNESLREELNELCGTYNLYRRNKLDLFEIMQESMDAIVPQEVEQFIGAFAEVKTFAMNQKPQFKIKTGKMRAKKFATRAAASGVYETFRLDSDVIDVNTLVIGDAAYIDFERFISGEEDWVDYMEALLGGILHAVYQAITDCIIAASTNLTAHNMYHLDSSYNAENFAALVNKVKHYGGAVIVACPEFTDDMGPDAIVAGTTNYQGIYNPADIEAIAQTGRIKQFRGTPIVELPQSVVDESNTTLVFDPAYTFIFPTNGEKIVKVAMEGDTVVEDWKNRDNSMEIQAYKKMGTAILTYNNWAMYKNSSLSKTLS